MTILYHVFDTCIEQKLMGENRLNDVGKKHTGQCPFSWQVTLLNSLKVQKQLT